MDRVGWWGLHVRRRRFALDQTVDVLDDGTVFIRTGGGGRFGQLMWLRDAMTQMHALLPLAARPTGVATRAIVGAALAKAVQVRRCCTTLGVGAVVGEMAHKRWLWGVKS